MARTKSEFVIALAQLAAERNLPKEVIVRTLEAALASTFRKDSPASQNVSVKLVPQTGEVKVYVQKVVVEKATDLQWEISLSEAQRLKNDVQLSETIEVESTPENAGRIVAQTTKQVMLQRLHEVERDIIFGEYADKEGDTVSGVVQYVDPRQVNISLGRAEAILPLAEQVQTERYRVGQRLKLYLLKVLRSSRGTQLIVSRSHPEFVRRLFELEVPEIYNGTVELKAIAREAGYRSKVAVATCQKGVDPVGCCVGLRSIRIQNITKELNGERIDIVQWDPDPAVFIANALSPSSVAEVEINEEEKVANVVVPDKQLSLAIGKGGQNARLAARLSGWRIDIKSLSMAEAQRSERIAQEALAEEVSVIEPAKEEALLEPPTMEAPEELLEPSLTLVEELEETPETPPAEPARIYSIEEVLSELETATPPSPIRFAEGLQPRDSKPDTKAEKDKSGGITKPKKPSRRQPVIPEDEDYE